MKHDISQIIHTLMSTVSQYIFLPVHGRKENNAVRVSTREPTNAQTSFSCKCE